MKRHVWMFGVLISAVVGVVSCGSAKTVNAGQSGEDHGPVGSAAVVTESTSVAPPVSMISTPPPAPTNPSTSGVPEAVRKTCETAAAKTDAGATNVERGEEVSASQVAKWQTERFANSPFKDTPSPFANVPPQERFTVCLLSGHFVTPHPPELPDHDRMRIIVAADGTVTVDSAGYAGDKAVPDLPTDVIGNR